MDKNNEGFSEQQLADTSGEKEKDETVESEEIKSLKAEIKGLTEDLGKLRTEDAMVQAKGGGEDEIVESDEIKGLKEKIKSLTENLGKLREGAAKVQAEEGSEKKDNLE